MLEKITKTFSWFAALILILIIFFILEDIFISSYDNISFSFLLDDPLHAGRSGGIFPIIISTISILAICIAVVLPVGIGSALFLSECRAEYPLFVKIARRSIEILSGVPSIVFGLFGNALFSLYFKLGFSILSGGLTLALMCLPLFVKTLEEAMRSVPSNYRTVPISLGMSRTTTILTIIIPYVIPAISIGLILSIGRALAETAALIFTSGYVDRMPESFLDSGRSLSIHIYDLAMNVPGGDTNAYNTAFVLICLILIVNGLLNTSFKYWYKKRIAL